MLKGLIYVTLACICHGLAVLTSGLLSIGGSAGLGFFMVMALFAGFRAGRTEGMEEAEHLHRLKDREKEYVNMPYFFHGDY